MFYMYFLYMGSHNGGMAISKRHLLLCCKSLHRQKIYLIIYILWIKLTQENKKKIFGKKL